MIGVKIYLPFLVLTLLFANVLLGMDDGIATDYYLTAFQNHVVCSNGWVDTNYIMTLFLWCITLDAGVTMQIEKPYF